MLQLINCPQVTCVVNQKVIKAAVIKHGCDQFTAVQDFPRKSIGEHGVSKSGICVGQNGLFFDQHQPQFFVACRKPFT